MVDATEVRGLNTTQKGSRLVMPPESFANFTTAADQSGNRVLLQTMTYLEDGDFPHKVTASLGRASLRGADVVFKYDASSHVSLDGHISLTPVPIRRRKWSEEVLEQREETNFRLTELMASGVKVLP